MTASMWTELTSDERAWKDRCRRFAEDVMRPLVQKYDHENRFPAEVHAAAHDWGLMNACFAPEHGGQGLSQRAIAIGGEELGAVCAPIGFSLGFNHGSLQPALYAGTSEQKQVFVRDLLRRREYASLCMTEPGRSGSNLLSMQTKARSTGGSWVISGTKCMTGMGTESSLFFVFAETEINGADCGMSVFAVPRCEAVKVGPNIDKLGFRCVPTPTVLFEGVEVPRENLIGQVGQAERILIHCLDYMRFGGVPVILGLTVGGLRDIVPWVETRALSRDEMLMQKSDVQLRLGRYYAELQGVRMLLWRAAGLLDEGVPCGIETSMAKSRASALAMEATQNFVRMMGWRGIDGAYPAQKRMRDAMATSIFEGTNEILDLHAFRDLRRQFHAAGGDF